MTQRSLKHITYVTKCTCQLAVATQENTQGTIIKLTTDKYPYHSQISENNTVRWANVQAIDVKFSQDLTHQKIIKIG